MDALKSSLGCWELVTTVGLLMVIIGVAGEGAELVSSLILKCHFREKFTKKFLFAAWSLVVLGLLIEMRGGFKVSQISGEMQTILNKEASLAREQASSNELKVAEIELKLRRRISPEHKEEFIRLLRDRWKIPVRVFVGQTDVETDTFAQQLRQTLDEAGYAVTNGDGIAHIDGLKYISPIGDLGFDLPMAFIFYGPPGQEIIMDGLRVTFIGKRDTVYAIYQDRPNSAIGFLDQAFQKIGLKPGAGAWTNVPIISKPEDWAIFVPQKF